MRLKAYGEGKVMDSSSPIVRFYSGEATDDRGRTLADIQALDHSRMEYFHDFIQWMFPLRDPSQYNPSAPLLTDADVAAFRDRPELRENLAGPSTASSELPGPGILRRRGPRGQGRADRRKIFAIPNHNWLRITRVLLCLKTLGLDQECRRASSPILKTSTNAGWASRPRPSATGKTRREGSCAESLAGWARLSERCVTDHQAGVKTVGGTSSFFLYVTAGRSRKFWSPLPLRERVRVRGSSVPAPVSGRPLTPSPSPARGEGGKTLGPRL